MSPRSPIHHDPAAPRPGAISHGSASDTNGAEAARRQSQLLDEALEETFPASDPVSIAFID